MLDGEPAIRTVAHVRVDAKTQFVDVEPKRLVLIVDVHAHHADTLIHHTSLVDATTVSVASQRRFSETALVRSGRCAAFRMQAGTWSSRGMSARTATPIA